MTASRRCSECSASLTGMQSTAKTCGENCRKKRTRRLAKKKTRVVPEHLAPMHDAVVAAQEDVLHDVAVAELTPIVREAITDDVLLAVDKLMRNVLPAALDAIADDIAGEDKDLRQRAYTLLMKYTLGNPSVAPKQDAPSGQQVVVNFELPRAGSAPADVEAEADEQQTCSECGTERSISDFLEASTRCVHCDAALRARVDERFSL